MFELFANPAALTVGGAMVSSPILIHLINRMRFKRLRWAAMEFLLKSQKRNRRRLIIEQLLLLLLRCLLIALATLLLARFIGFAFGTTFEQVANTHVILLDDSLSMKDQVKGRDDCFTLAKKKIESIAANVGQSTTPDGIAILPLSELVFNGDKFEPDDRRRLGEPSSMEKLKADLKAMKCSSLSLPLAPGLAAAKKIADDSTDKITVHLLTDFRRIDWTGEAGKDVHKLMLDLGRHKNVKKVYLIDCAHPTREPGHGGVPAYHDNIALVEVRPNTRVATPGSTIFCTVTVANFSPRDADVRVVPFDDESGEEMREKDYETPMPLKVSAGKSAQATFSFPVRKDVKDDQRAFYRVGVRLQNAAGLDLDNDGLKDDDVRHAVIEVRKTIPVLLIDGRGAQGLNTLDGDSYFLSTALKNIANSKYELQFGHVLSGGDAREALESPELGQFTSILMLNVPELQNEKQLANLERFVREGGGVAFFMGPDVKAKYYNEQFYKKGFGVFPVPLADTYEPVGPMKQPEYTGRFLVLLRDDQFPKTEKLPIFGPVFKEPRLREFLKHLPVQRYWPALPYKDWVGEPGKVREVANMPNESMASAYTNLVRELAKRLPFDRDDFKEYKKGLQYHAKVLGDAVGENAKYPAYMLADLLNKMLEDKGKDEDRANYPNMAEFWDLRDQTVQDLKLDVVNLRKRLLYSSPLVVVKDYGQGRVVGWMTTSGKEWNPWAAGVTGAAAYAPLMYELQNYLTSQSGDSGQIVGAGLTLSVDAKRFLQNKSLKVTRKYYEPVQGKPEVAGAVGEFTGTKEKTAWTIKLDPALHPGFYQSNLHYGDADSRSAPLTAWGHAFNVDSKKEGNLQRVSQEDLDSGFMRQTEKTTVWSSATTDQLPDLINKAWDLSEWPYFFLFFICVLVAEQALAVHLSFHLKTSEAELPQVLQPRVKAA